MFQLSATTKASAPEFHRRLDRLTTDPAGCMVKATSTESGMLDTALLIYWAFVRRHQPGAQQAP